MHAYQVSLKSDCFQEKRNEGAGGKNPGTGHVTPSFLTDDEEEFQLNIEFNFRIPPRHQSESLRTYMRFESPGNTNK